MSGLSRDRVQREMWTTVGRCPDPGVGSRTEGARLDRQPVNANGDVGRLVATVYWDCGYCGTGVAANVNATMTRAGRSA